MNRVALVTVLVVVGVAAPAATVTAQVESAVVEPTPAAADPGNASEANGTSNASLGASVSAFMQSNSERASHAVDQGMWSAAFERSDRARKQTLAESHAGTLGERLDALAEQRQELVAAYRNGSIGKVAFQARMSALGERYRALNRSVDDTKRAVDRENVDAPGLSDLDRSLQRGAAAAGAGNGSLPANVTVPGFERGSNGLSFGDNRTTGPPDDRTTGPPDNRTTGQPGDGAQGNGNGGPGDADRGPPANASAPNASTITLDTTTILDGNETLDATVAGPNAEQTPF